MISQQISPLTQVSESPAESHVDDGDHGLTERPLTQVTHLAVSDARTHVKGFLE